MENEGRRGACAAAEVRDRRTPPCQRRDDSEKRNNFLWTRPLTRRTGPATPRALWRGGGTPAPTEKRTGAGRAPGGSTARQWRPLSRAVAAADRTVPGPGIYI